LTEIVNSVIPIEAIKPHPRNYREHPDPQIKKLKASHERFSQYRSVVVWQRPGGQYIQVAGHGIVQAMRERGVTRVRADILPESTLQEDIDGILAADNLLSNEAVDDESILVQLLQGQQDAGYDLATLGTDDEALRQMLEALGDEPAGYGGGGDEEDEFEQEVDEEQTRVQVGDVWQLGRHIIACMNSCNIDAVQKLIGKKHISLVFADPPYGISIVATNVSVGGGEAYDIPFGGVKNRTRGDVGGTASHIRKTGKSYLEEWQEKKNGPASKGLGSPNGAKPFGSRSVRGSDGAANVVDVGKYAPIIGDDTTETAIVSSQICLELFPGAVHVWWGANYYANTLPPSKCWIVWDKENTGNFADAELAWCSADRAVRIFRHMWNGMLKASEHGQKRVHPSQKPCALASYCFTEFGHEGDWIFDPFLGSGISVIAAERLGDRSVIGCELSADYINVVLSRWEKETGQAATLLERAEEVVHA